MLLKKGSKPANKGFKRKKVDVKGPLRADKGREQSAADAWRW